MSSYLAVDGGTTNTRIYYVRDHNILGVEKICMGVRSGSSDPFGFKNTIKRSLEVLQLRFGTASSVLVAGMLTSEMGLYEVAHLTAPVGIADLHCGIKTITMPELTPLPIKLIPGVKYMGTCLAETDMMRGEECELIGLSDKLFENTAYILPGSHSKLIFTDSRGRISSFYTQLSGEMAAVLSQNTILKTSIDLAQSLNHEYLRMGYHYAANYGINEALFKVRVLKNIFNKTTQEVTSFFLGVIFNGEVTRVIHSNASKIVISGQINMKQALSVLLNDLVHIPVITVTEETASHAVVNGMVNIYEYRS